MFKIAALIIAVAGNPADTRTVNTMVYTPTSYATQAACETAIVTDDEFRTALGHLQAVVKAVEVPAGTEEIKVEAKCIPDPTQE